MATKNYCLPFQGKHDLSVIGPSIGRYGNINLNRKHQCLTVENVHSNDFSNKNKNVENYSKATVFFMTEIVNKNLINEKASLKFTYLTHDSQRSKSSFSWKTSEKKLPSEFSNIHFASDKKESKNGKDSNKSNNASTISLHITAYENSIDAVNNSLPVTTNGRKKLTKDFAETCSIKNGLEFPRTPTTRSSKPEVMQFKASQKLFTPHNTRADAAAIQQSSLTSDSNSQNDSADNQLDSAMPFEGVWGLSKELKKKGVLLFHNKRTKRSFVFQVRNDTNSAICINCYYHRLKHNKELSTKTYKVNGSTFEANPGLAKNHYCEVMTKEKVVSEQIYRQTLRFVSGTNMTSATSYNTLVTKFEDFYGKRKAPQYLKLLKSKREIKKTMGHRAKKGKYFAEEHPDDN